MPVPVVSLCTPAIGPTTGGTAVNITGSNFTGSTAVSFGGTPVTSFNVVTSGLIQAVTAAHIAGLVNIDVTNPSGTGTGVNKFTYSLPTITYITPPSGQTIGGSVIGIGGNALAGATSVTVDGIAVSFVLISSFITTVIYVSDMPAHAAGAATVAVTTPAGTGTGTFTYTTPPVPAYNISLFDDCCHNWFSLNAGGTWEEGATPGGPGTPAPDDPGQDPHGIGTLLDTWSDCQMAINDADYLTMLGVDFDYDGFLSIIATSPSLGRNLTWTLIDPEKSTTGIPPSPAFMPQDDPDFGVDWQNALFASMTGNAQTILFCTNASSSSPFYPRISRDAGATWNDLTSVPANQPWACSAFSAGAQIIYLMPDNSGGGTVRLYKSSDNGASFSQLAGGPTFSGFFPNEANIRIRCSADGQVVVLINSAGTIWVSVDGGANWTSTNLSAATGHSSGRFGDCSVTPDGGTIIASFEQIINSGFWPAVFKSTNGGASFTNISANIQYPGSIGSAAGGAPGTNPTGCTQCNVAPDGLAMVVTFIYGDTFHTEPDGLNGEIMYANVSLDGGATFILCGYNADPYESGSFLGLFTGIYITPYTPLPVPATPEVHRQIRDPWDCDEWGRFQPGVCIRRIS